MPEFDDPALATELHLHELSERRMMGLPDRYTPPAVPSVAAVVSRLQRAPAVELAALVEDATAPLATRFGAGSLLALLGDPRDVVGEPAMVDVPAGTAVVGLDPSRLDEVFESYRRYGVERDWIEKECPRFTVELEAFRIGRYPVTNAQYQAFLEDADEDELPTSWAYGRFPPGLENHPVWSVTPEAADRYVAWLAARTGRPFRLPTELEWEYAAAGPDGLDFPWGMDFDAELANTAEGRHLMTTPIGCYPAGASWCGALDMAGNVEEYVADCYAPYPGARLVEDALFRRVGFYRVARGGAFNHFRDLARCQRRHGLYPGFPSVMGLRVAE